MFNILKNKNNKGKNAGKGKAVKNDKIKDYKEEIEKEVVIYAMPERFRAIHEHKIKAKTTGLIIIIGGAVFLIAVSILLYYYLIKEQPVKSTPAATSTGAEIDTGAEKSVNEELKPDIEPAVIKNPKESYIEIKTEFDKTRAFNDFEQAILKYGSKNKIKELEKEKRRAEGMPENFKENIISLIIRLSMPKLSEIDDIKVEINGNTAILTATTGDLTKKGTITMKLENKIWKLESESWTDAEEKPIVINVMPIETDMSNGQDSDGDGLTDKEENIFGSDPDSMDSDGDGYGDLSEVKNLYNPAGDGKLENSALVKKYINSSYGYNLIYPADWTVNNIGGDDSIIFKSNDNHFIQIITQPNKNIQSIEAWYKQQFDVSIIDNRKLAGVGGWQGVRSDDGLIIYLTDSERVNIYTISYNLGNQNIIEYKNIFEIMINSFDLLKP